MASKRTVLMRLDIGMAGFLRELARKNNISITQASRDAAKALKGFNGKKISRVVQF